MITDILLKVFGKDPHIKRNLAKTISWRLVGSVDTALLGWLVTGKLSTGATIGITELFTKLLLYYFHERVWQNIRFGMLTRLQKRRMVQSEVQPNLFKQAGKISRQQREALNISTSFTLWLTGLSGAGKSTIATELELLLYQNLYRVYILDGDNTRLGINSDLSFSDDDRSENIRRVAEISKLFNDAGIIVIASFISPFAVDRQVAQNIIGPENFIEVFVDASLDECKRRDPKGLYRKAISGQLKSFTGIDSPYEPPVTPDVHLHTDRYTIAESTALVKRHLESKGMEFNAVAEPLSVALPIR